MSHADKVLVAVTDKGPIRMGKLGKATKCTFISRIVRKLAAAGKVKVEGKRNAIVYVPGQDLQAFKDAEAPDETGTEKPQKKKKKKGGAGKAAKRGKPRKEVDDSFIPGLTADGGMVTIGKGDAPIVFSPAQTEKIATLLFSHYNA